MASSSSSVQASIAANTWVACGSPQTKKLLDILPSIIHQLGNGFLKSLCSEIQSQASEEIENMLCTKEGRIKCFHYHGSIAQRKEPCKILVNSTQVTIDKIPYVLDTTLRDIAGVIKKFELKMIRSRLQKTRL